MAIEDNNTCAQGKPNARDAICVDPEDFGLELLKIYGIVALMAECHESLDVLTPDQRSGLFTALFDLAHDAHCSYRDTIQGLAILGRRQVLS